MNGHDSEKLAGILRDMGYAKAENKNEAGVIIVNTCCVRGNAENRFYGNLGHLKHIKDENSYVRIAVCGCMAQRKDVVEKILSVYKHVDIIFGTHNLNAFPRLLQKNLETNKTVVEILNERRDGDIDENDANAVRENKYKASINIIHGCNNFCSYCIVPYVRGREKSRDPRVIIDEAKLLINDGVKEIMLLGQNVNSYGKDFYAPHNELKESFITDDKKIKDAEINFASLLYELNELDSLLRIRFMTSNPKDLTDELIDAVAKCDKVCKHLHLPLQSGSTRVLKDMNRKYTKEEYIALAEKIKRKIPGVSLTTDIIVGFPGETEEDFDDTLDVVSRVKFSNAFTFIYSKRPGTPAAEMENQIDETTVKRRFEKLLALLNDEIHKINSARVGCTLEVFAEEENRNLGLFTGRADDNTLVHFTGDPSLVGSLADVKITDSKTFYLIGTERGLLVQ